MRTTKNPFRMKFSVIVWCVLAVLLWAVPCGADTYFVFWDETLPLNDGTYANDSIVVFGGILNVNPGANVARVVVWDGTANIYGGIINDYLQVDASTPNPTVTIYGSGFALLDSEGNGVPLVNGSGEPLSEFSFDLTDDYGFGRLTGIYEDGEPVNGDPINGLAFYLYDGVPLHLAVSAPEVVIDIKPGSDTNPINLKSKGVVPVAILTTDVFNAAEEVNPATVEFAGAAPLRWTLEDVDGDGDKDMLFHFRTELLNLDQNSTEATLKGKTTEGVTFEATDEVQIVPAKK